MRTSSGLCMLVHDKQVEANGASTDGSKPWKGCSKVGCWMQEKRFQIKIGVEAGPAISQACGWPRARKPGESLQARGSCRRTKVARLAVSRPSVTCSRIRRQRPAVRAAVAGAGASTGLSPNRLFRP